MKEQLQLKNHLKEFRTEANLSQTQLAEMVGVSRNTISSIETGQFNPTAKLALILCIALDKKFEDLHHRRRGGRRPDYRQITLPGEGSLFRITEPLRGGWRFRRRGSVWIIC